MSEPVKIRRAQTEQTEARILAAAAELFVANGYLATTLAAIAEAAGVGARTVYVRFGTKAALLSRVVDVAVVGDTAPLALLQRPENRRSFAGPDAGARIEQAVEVGVQIMRRAGDLFVVASEAAVVEPELQQRWQDARLATREAHRLLWQSMVDDGLLADSIDLKWLIDTTTVIGSAETYILGRRLYRWTIPAYRRWLIHSYLHLAGIAGSD